MEEEGEAEGKSSQPGVNNATAILHLEPEQGSVFYHRKIQLSDKRKLIRRSQQKVPPKSFNAVFQNKMVSRNHAEIWLENGKVFIRDTGSSNGTVVNGVRLSASGEESDPVELHTGDHLQLGDDILREEGAITCIRALITIEDVTTETTIDSEVAVEEELVASVDKESDSKECEHPDHEDTNSDLKNQIQKMREELERLTIQNDTLTKEITVLSQERQSDDHPSTDPGEREPINSTSLSFLYESIKHSAKEADALAMQMTSLTEVLTGLQVQTRLDYKELVCLLNESESNNPHIVDELNHSNEALNARPDLSTVEAEASHLESCLATTKNLLIKIKDHVRTPDMSPAPPRSVMQSNSQLVGGLEAPEIPPEIPPHKISEIAKNPSKPDEISKKAPEKWVIELAAVVTKEDGVQFIPTMEGEKDTAPTDTLQHKETATMPLSQTPKTPDAVVEKSQPTKGIAIK
eukprot:Ihof_evm1s999 gene=Ihof_evmTU1s999